MSVRNPIHLVAIVAFAAVAFLASATPAGADHQPGYTDGTETHEDDWGAPPGEWVIDEPGCRVGIDPPQPLHVTLHATIDDTPVHAVAEYGASVPGIVWFDLLPLGFSEPGEHRIEGDSSWTIGSGRSARLDATLTCVEAPAPTTTTTIPEEPQDHEGVPVSIPEPPEPVVELAPPITAHTEPVATPPPVVDELPVTGSSWWLTAAGVAALTVGAILVSIAVGRADPRNRRGLR